MSFEEKAAAIVVCAILFVQPFFDPDPFTFVKGALSLIGLMVIAIIAVDLEISRFWRDVQRFW